MNHIEELFKEYFKPSYFKLIDNSHPLSLYIGADEQGYKAIEYRGDFKPFKLNSTEVVGIEHHHNKDDVSIVISLLHDDMLSTFSSFCMDLVESTSQASNEEEGYKILVNRIYAWKKMFVSKHRLLEEHEIIGLMGELIHLKEYIIPEYGKAKAISSWTGSEKTKKDFSLDQIWFEVKTIHCGNDFVTISSFEQLESEKDGELIVYQLEKMSPQYNGITLNKIAREVLVDLNLFELKDLFSQKLLERGFGFESDYNQFVYQLICCDKYQVTSDFPCLRRTYNMGAIAQVKYDLLLSKIENFKIL